MKKITLLTLLSFFSSFSQAQNFSYGWHEQIPPMNLPNFDAPNQRYSEILNDTLYIFYQHYGDSVDVDPSATVELIEDEYNNGISAMFFVSRHSVSTGAYLGSTKLIEIPADANNGVTVIDVVDFDVSPDGKFIIAGLTLTGVDFDGSANSEGWYSAIPAGSFVAFYTTAGASIGHVEYPLPWSGVPFNSSVSDGFFISTAKADELGNVYFSGGLLGSTDLDFSAGVDMHSSVGGIDCSIIKINGVTQSFAWAKSFGGALGDATYLSAISNNQLVIAGQFSSPSLDLDPGTGTFTATNPMTGEDPVFLARFDGNGNFLNGGSFGGNTYITLIKLKSDADGSVYLLGDLDDALVVDFDLTTATSNPFPSYQGFLVKYADDFSVEQLTSINEAYYIEDFALGSDFIAISGEIELGTDLLVHSSVTNTVQTLTTDVDAALVVAVHKTNAVVGDAVLYKRIYNRYTYVATMTADDNNNLLLAGQFRDAMDFNQFNAIDDVDSCTYAAPNNFDLFVTRLNWAGFAGTNVLETSTTVEVFPNPASEFLVVRSENAISSIVVSDLSGKTVLEIKGNNQEELLISLLELESGNYFVHVHSTNDREIVRIVVQ